MDDLWRDVLLAFGVIIIVWIGWEAFRISRNKRNEHNTEQENEEFETNKLDDDFSYGNELPSGGARTRKATDEDIQRQKTIYKPGEPVPILMKTVQRPIDVKSKLEDDVQANEQSESLDQTADDSMVTANSEAGETADVSIEEGDAHQQISLSLPVEDDAIEPPSELKTSVDSEADSKAAAPQIMAAADDDVELDVSLHDDDIGIPEEVDLFVESDDIVEHDDSESDLSSIDTVQENPDDYDDAQSHAQPDQANEVFVINVVGRNNKEFDGQTLLDLFLSCQLKFGEMEIFHYRDAKSSAKLFSVANGVNPGTFDLHGMGDLSTPGIMFFMQVPNKADPDLALEYMYKAASHFAEELDGYMQDEQRSVLTPQTFEFYKQRLQEFKRGQLVHH
jgi:cell division protein ZipA